MTIEGLGNKVLVQVCLIVDDVEKYAKTYSEILGLPIGEYHYTAGFSETEATYYGSPTEAKAKIIAWHFGNVDLELLQPLGGPSIWQDFLDQNGPGVHHVAYRVNDTDAVAQSFVNHGFQITQQGFFTGRFPNGGHEGVYTYLDTVKELNTTFELLEDYDPNGEVR